MGYQSRMECNAFESKYSPKQINKMWETYSSLFPNGLCDYGFEGEGTPDKAYIIGLCELGDWMKFTDTDELARFISMITMDHVHLWFVGEDMQRWGYIIEPGIAREENIVPGDIVATRQPYPITFADIITAIKKETS